MARLRSPVERSLSNTASSTPSSRPAKRPRAWRISSNASPPVLSAIRPEQAMAPAFTMALNGLLSARRRMELNASPLGSTPMAASTRSAPSRSSARANTMAFDTDWMVKGTCVSPAS